MAQLLRKFVKPLEIRTTTQQGECTVNIKLEIVLSVDDDGGIKMGVRQTHEKESPETNDGPEWAIPDFGDIPKVTNFGKQV